MDGDAVFLPRLALELEDEALLVLDLNVFLANGGEAVGVIPLRVLFVADADEGKIKQAYDCCEDTFAVEGAVRVLEVRLNTSANLWEEMTELEHSEVVGVVLVLCPELVVTVLFATLGVVARGLQMAVTERTDPDFFIRGRDS